MLNISEHSIEKEIDKREFTSMQIFRNNKHYTVIRKIIWGIFILLILFLFLPWTQNVEANGFVTALNPSQRPQNIQTVIDGRIEKWYIKEGQYVKKGDTIMYISEVNTAYLDPNLITNTQNQLSAKKGMIEAYDLKIDAIKKQIKAVENEGKLKRNQAKNKIQQTKLKVESDSIELVAVKRQLNIAKNQYDRAVSLYKEGLKSQIYLEQKRIKFEQMKSKWSSQENKYLVTQSELLNHIVELDRLIISYTEKKAKLYSNLQATKGTLYSTQSQISKLKTSIASYKIRNTMHYITAPQDGYINKALQSGIGETIKKGASIVSIVPTSFDYAVEAYILPIEYPLIKTGEKIRISFDGWPSIVFSGWPGASFGTFGGIIVAKENFISKNGKYRILIAPDPNQDPWPKLIGVGSGAHTLALLDTVPIWYEIWRTLNGFPPNFYESPQNNNQLNNIDS